MALNFTFSDFNNFKLNPNFRTDPMFLPLMRNAFFGDKEDRLAIIGFGGTFSSHYSPSEETIYASDSNPLSDLLVDLQKSFGVASTDFDFISLGAQDSRNISIRDVEMVINFGSRQL